MNDEFVSRIVKMRGEKGRAWIDSLPSQIKHYEEVWGMRVSEPFRLTNNYVAPAIRKDGTTAVLKIRFPNDIEFPGEYHALQVFNGAGSVKLLEVDEVNAVMLLEKIEPGTFLRTVENDEELISLFCGVIRTLDKPAETVSGFQTLAGWGKGFDRLRKRYDGTTGPFPKYLFEKAESIFRDYTEKPDSHFFLHGDLHKDNILLSHRGWLAIDPMGVVGEHEFETAMFLKNPYYDLHHESTRKSIIERRVSQFSSELGFDKTKMYRWAFAQAMMSALWLLEDYNEVSYLYIRNAELLHEFLP